MQIQTDRYRLINGECLSVMDQLIEEGIKVDCIITDLPYGTTKAEWDKPIPFEPMWERIDRLIKPNGAIVLFGNEPFSSRLRLSNLRNYKYDWKWIKQRGTGHLNAKKQPMKNIEDIMVFYKKQCVYNPQMLEGKAYTDKRAGQSIEKTLYNQAERQTYINKSTRYPVNGIKFNKVCVNQVHNTQKPTDLLQYLVKTYTDENQVVLDFTAGSFSTGVACMLENRKFIGIEKEEKFFNIGKSRLEEIIN